MLRYAMDLNTLNKDIEQFTPIGKRVTEIGQAPKPKSLLNLAKAARKLKVSRRSFDDGPPAYPQVPQRFKAKSAGITHTMRRKCVMRFVKVLCRKKAKALLKRTSENKTRKWLEPWVIELRAIGHCRIQASPNHTPWCSTHRANTMAKIRQIGAVVVAWTDAQLA